MILLLTPTAIESKYLKSLPAGIQHKVCGIGIPEDQICEDILNLKPKLVVLFGCCGLTQDRLPLKKIIRKKYFEPLNQLWIPKFWHHRDKILEIDQEQLDYFNCYEFVNITSSGLTVDHSVHSRAEKKCYVYYTLLDQESFYYVDFCHDHDIPIVVVRYGEDYCDQKMIPIPVVNHFYHYWNHYYNQQNLLKILGDIGQEAA